MYEVLLKGIEGEWVICFIRKRSKEGLLGGSFRFDEKFLRLSTYVMEILECYIRKIAFSLINMFWVISIF